MSAKARLGQNFLVDENYIGKILSAVNAEHKDHIFEIGPGKGVLTTELVRSAGKVTAVEIDRRLAEGLTEKLSNVSSVEIICEDILEFDMKRLSADKYKAVSNLPYYISSPVLRMLVRNIELFSVIYLLVQKEVAERIIGAEKSTRGFLSHYVNFHCIPEYLFPVPAKAFRPVPEVESVFLSITPKEKTEFLKGSEDDFFDFIKICFTHRRKTLKVNLKKILSSDICSKDILAKMMINPMARAEDLSLGDFVKLFNGVKDESS